MELVTQDGGVLSTELGRLGSTWTSSRFAGQVPPVQMWDTLPLWGLEGALGFGGIPAVPEKLRREHGGHPGDPI